MRIAITGGTGFVGSHLAERLVADGHDVVLLSRGIDDRNRDRLERGKIRFVASSVTDGEAVRDAFVDCDAVAHLAGINYERGRHTYDAVHVRGTRTVVDAATDVGASKLILTSYLRARPDCGSDYHESKWMAEEIVRSSDLTSIVLKPGVVFGPGDRMLWAVARSLATVPVFPGIGFRERRLCPLAVEDLVDVLTAATSTDLLDDATIAVMGPEEVTLRQFVERVGDVVGRNPRFLPIPIRALVAAARIQERVMVTPIVTTAGVRMLSEGGTEPAPTGVCDPLPGELDPARRPSRGRIEAAHPDRRPLGLADLRI